MEASIAEPGVGPATDEATQSPGSDAVTPAAKAIFVAVYTREYPRIVAYARRRTGDLHSAEEIAVEVFRIAWEQLASGVPSTGWLFVTARNLLHTHHRQALRNMRLRHKLEQEREREADQSRSEPIERVQVDVTSPCTLVRPVTRTATAGCSERLRRAEIGPRCDAGQDPDMAPLCVNWPRGGLVVGLVWRVREVAFPKCWCGDVSRPRWMSLTLPVALPGSLLWRGRR